MYVLFTLRAMAKAVRKSTRQVTRKSSSIGTGGRGRRCKISTSTMNFQTTNSTVSFWINIHSDGESHGRVLKLFTDKINLIKDQVVQLCSKFPVYK